MHISLTNSKLGDKIPSLNLPALLTCRADAPCRKGCYACKGNWLFPKVKQSLKDNLEEFVEDPDKFFKRIQSWLNDGDVVYRFFRWFSSGDIVNARFFKGIVETAKACPQTRFLCFTKKFSIVNSYVDEFGDLPENLHVVFSAWDNTFKVDNPHNLPMTFVFFKDSSKNAAIPEYAIPCEGSCKSCKACWSLEKGQSVYFHQH